MKKLQLTLRHGVEFNRMSVDAATDRRRYELAEPDASVLAAVQPWRLNRV